MPDPLPILPDACSLPEKTTFGRGKITSLPSECARFGRRGLLVHGHSLDADDTLKRILDAAPPGLEVVPFRHRGGEPTLAQVAEALTAARRCKAEWIAGVGGGSVLDLAKAVAALMHAAQPLADYHDGLAIERAGIAFVAAPTTAGTGSEATVNSVLTNEASGAKKSIRDIGMMARVVILDPALLASCPRPVIAASGMDALTQAIESFTSRKATWLSETLALKGLTLIAAHLEKVYHDPGNPSADPLLEGSYFTGIALSLSRLGVVHGLAHPLGALYHVPHGQVCAVCLPHAIALNREAFGPRYERMSQAVGRDLLQCVRELIARLGIESPFAGKPLDDRELIIRETLASGSTHANPRTITRADVEALLDTLFTPAPGPAGR
jgi:alcohol dehydrogenase class IV